MKLRYGFVSNNSSTIFTITNTSRITKTTVDFVEEVGEKMLRDWDDEYGVELTCTDDEGVTLWQLMKDAKSDTYFESFEPDQSRNMSFGDEHGTALGHLFDYMLREGGKSRSFRWKFHEWLR